MKKGLKTYIFLLLVAPVFVHAEWYWLNIPEDPDIGEFTELSAVQYAITSIPKEQLQLVQNTLIEIWDETKKSEACSNERELAIQEMREFDANHEMYNVVYFKGMGNENVFNQETADARASLLLNLENTAKNCLVKEAKNLEEKARKEAEEKRLNEVNNAIKNCNFDFFDNEMTNAERMNTWSDRESCKNKPVSVIETVASNPVEAVPSVKQEIVPYIIPAITTDTNPVVSKMTQTKHEGDVIGNSEYKVEATTTDAIAERSTEEPKEIVVESVQAENVMDNKSFFRKITNFFIKLFSW